MTAKRQQVIATVTTNPQSASPLGGFADFPAAYIGSPWGGALYGVGGTGSYGYSVVAKPSWMTLTVSGNLLIGSGTPTSGGSGSVTVDISDGASTQRVSYYIRVTATISGVSGEVRQAQSAYSGKAYTFDPATLLNNPTLPLTSVVVSAGTLPTGMSVASNIITASNVSGTTQDVTLTITDGAAQVAVKAVRFTVKPALSFNTTSLPPAVLGHQYYAKLDITGGSGSYSVTAQNTAATTSQGITVDPATGILSGPATSLSPTSGALSTRFVIADLITGETLTTSLMKVPVNASVPAAPRGRFPISLPDGSLDTTDLFSGWFGSGIDGAFVLDGTNTYAGYFSKSGSTYTQLRPIYATNITVGTGVTWIAPFPWFVNGNLDVSAANCRIQMDGGDASGVTKGSSAPPSTWFGPLAGRGVSGNGGTSTASGSNPGAAASPSTNDGGIGVAGNGGASNNATGGGVQSTAWTANAPFPIQTPFTPLQQFWGFYNGGLAAGGGAAGPGNGTLAGGNGGGAGGPPGIVYGFAYTITTSASTSARTFSAKGGNAASGVAAPGAGRGAGGGGGGPSGGIVWLVCVFRDGPQVTSLIDVSGGNAGLKGAQGAGLAAFDGNPGTSGFAFAFVLSTQTAVTRDITAPVGTTGGVGTLTF